MRTILCYLCFNVCIRFMHFKNLVEFEVQNVDLFFCYYSHGTIVSAFSCFKTQLSVDVISRK